MPRGPLLARFEIRGAPPTKKTSQQPVHLGIPRGVTMNIYMGMLADMLHDSPGDVISRLRRLASSYRLIILPSEAYRDALRWWVPQAKAALTAASSPTYGTADFPVIVGAIYYLGARQRPDLPGLNEALSDLLQESGWIANDYHIARFWEGTRRERDPANPRTVVFLWAYEEPACQPPPTLPFAEPST